MIKKTTFHFLVCMSIIFSQPALAQSSEPATTKFSVGVKAGGNLYDTYESGTQNFVSQPNAGFHAGIFGDYAFKFLNQELIARVEALFSTRGLYLSESVDGQRIHYERQSSYVDFPISINYNIWKKLNIHVGVVPSLFLEEYRSVTKDANGFRMEEGDQFTSYERWQFGALAGASYPFNLMGQEFEGGARYSMGFTNTNELVRETRASRDPKYMMLQIFIAYKVFEF